AFFQFVSLAIHDVDAAVGDGGAGEAAADRGAPENFRAALRELGQDALFAPDTVAVGAEPLGPIVGAKARRAKQSKRTQEKAHVVGLLGSLSRKRRSAGFGGHHWQRRAVFFVQSEKFTDAADQAQHRIVEFVHDALFERDDAIVGDVNVF